MISISPLSTSLTYVAIFHLHLYMVYTNVYILQLIQYARACSTYDQFLIRGSLLTNKLMSKGFLKSCLQAAYRKFYGRYNDVV
jgi:hypothetical protein